MSDVEVVNNVAIVVEARPPSDVAIRLENTATDAEIEAVITQHDAATLAYGILALTKGASE